MPSNTSRALFLERSNPSVTTLNTVKNLNRSMAGKIIDIGRREREEKRKRKTERDRER